MSISEETLQQIIKSVVTQVESELGHKHSAPATGSQSATPVAPVKMKAVTNKPVFKEHTYRSSGEGIYTTVDEAVSRSAAAQKKYVKHFTMNDRVTVLNAIKQTVLSSKDTLSKMAVEETGIGCYEDKIQKHELVCKKTPGIEDLKTEAMSGDDGLTIIEEAPFGVIGAVTPVTNPTTTIINNSLSMLAAGNTVVFNVHPSSKKVCSYLIRELHQSIVQAGGPADLITMVADPTLDTLNELAAHPDIRLLVGTGGPGLVKSLLQSGKKAIGAGAGNPPVIVDETADLVNAAKSIILGASFDHNLLCIAEKEVFVLEEAANELIYQMLDQGAYMLNNEELSRVMSLVLTEDSSSPVAGGCTGKPSKKYHVKKEWIGQSAAAIARAAGINKENIKLLICETDPDHPFVVLEQMMPVLPIVKTQSFEEAVEWAVAAEKGNRHTAVIHSTNVDRMTAFARAIETTIFVKNASSLAGVGFGGEGHTTMTIAGPTGEGVTSARSFTRKRRCVLAEGGFRIIG
ncbi:aldehyde dehydrogenase [Jeotgalibacillus alimentarius]|uniref:Aldehyde dehydrogenase n=1 Tax=Jeotgalibacillus alimentarius TaxID=135826 RepID=A0A0C2VQH5_9BACL|nr:aldehyde dehydrogenase family protein [Jeotgalibacillus alimentarius]KIL46686.1 aldehyde dehydrogenase [Jeotgalibacillus alimentarius]